jgi:O-antigen/teichoic acid export membrane protein
MESQVNKKFLHLVHLIRLQILSTHFINAYALVASNLLTAFCGYIFWIIAARRFDDSLIGIASAALSSMALLDLLTNLGLGSGLIRFLPSLKNTNERNEFIQVANTARVLGVFSITIPFLIGLPIWAPGLISLSHQPILGFSFTLMILANGIFQILNSVLIGLQYAKYIFYGNILFNVVKIAIILFGPTTYGLLTVLVAVWLALFIVILVESFIFFPTVNLNRVLKPNFQFFRLKGFLTYSFANQIADIFLNLPQLLLPLLVLNFFGPSENSRFYTALMTVGIIRTASVSISQSTFAEGSNKTGSLYHNIKSGLGLSIIAIFAGSSIAYFLAPTLLMFFGKNYSSEGTILLRWLLLAVFPFNLISIFTTVHRIRKDHKLLLANTAIWAIISLMGASWGFINYSLLTVVIGWTLGQFVSTLINGSFFIFISLTKHYPIPVKNI